MVDFETSRLRDIKTSREVLIVLLVLIENKERVLIVLLVLIEKRFIDYAAGGRKKYYMVEEISPSPRRGDEQC